MQDPLPFALAQLDRLMAFFPRGDGKAAFVFAVDVALLGIVAFNFPYSEIRSSLLVAGFGVVAAAFLSLSVIQLCIVFVPHLNARHTKSVLYFGDIAKGTADEYRLRLKSITEAELLEDVACQVHRNSEILATKFHHLWIAQLLLFLSVVPFLLFLILLAGSGVALKWGP